MGNKVLERISGKLGNKYKIFFKNTFWQILKLSANKSIINENFFGTLKLIFEKISTVINSNALVEKSTIYFIQRFFADEGYIHPLKCTCAPNLKSMFTKSGIKGKGLCTG